MEADVRRLAEARIGRHEVAFGLLASDHVQDPVRVAQEGVEGQVEALEHVAGAREEKEGSVQGLVGLAERTEREIFYILQDEEESLIFLCPITCAQDILKLLF